MIVLVPLSGVPATAEVATNVVGPVLSSATVSCFVASADGTRTSIATSSPGFASSLPIAFYILGCAVIGIAATALLTDYTNKDISEEYDRVGTVRARAV